MNRRLGAPRAWSAVPAAVAALGFATVSPAVWAADDPPRETASSDVLSAQGILDAEGLGLRYRPPAPALARADSADGVLKYEVIDSAGQSPRWRLRLQSLTNSRAGMTAQDQVTAYLGTLRANNTQFTVRADEPLQVSGATGEGRLLLLEVPVGGGATGVTGWVIAPNGPDRFVVCSILATADDFPVTEPLLRKSFETLEIRSVETVEKERRERMARGEALLSFPVESLHAALDPEPIWYRIYRPATAESGEREVGFLSIQAREGRRGEVDATREAGKFSMEETELGMLVVLTAKSLLNAEGTNTVDSELRSWVAWDRSSEVWSLRSTQRQGEASRSTAQTGVRLAPQPGQPRPTLQVINSTGARNRDTQSWPVPPNYLSQAELQVLGRLLPKDDPSPASFASYAFDAKSDSVLQRIDRWRRNDDGTWTLETRVGGGAAPLIQTFAADGTRIRRVDEDATGTLITERIDLSTLRDMWSRKGLPTT